ncbi:MAG: hypothetical protein U1F77_10820 [Kiritimatiellia bacterium]
MIEPYSLQASLDRNKGALAQSEAQLDKAARDVARLQPLWEKNAISRQTLDDALAAERSARVGVDSPKPRWNPRRSSSAMRRSTRPSTASSARPRSARATWSAAGRARC